VETLKKEAINAISKLPESADIDDIMYRVYVIDKIKKGIFIATSNFSKEAQEYASLIENKIVLIDSEQLSI
jgi:restriction endonuclease Mrr